MADRIVDGATGVTIREMAGRSGTDTNRRDSGQRSFLLRGNSDPAVCRDALYNNRVALSLDDFDGNSLETISWDLFAADDQWKFVADYTWEPAPGKFTVSMDSTGGTINVTEAIAQARFDAPGETGGDFRTSINVDKQGNPKGVDIVIPALKLNISAKLSTGIAADPLAYAKIITNATGHTNSDVYLTFEAGELLFLGATGEIIGDNPLLTYTFAASPNIAGFDIGDITIGSKQGHDYLWVAYKTLKDATSKKNVELAVAGYVAQVYTGVPFDGLGIGT
jgi:hypothetical protein